MVKETSLAGITLRKYEKPQDIGKLQERELIKKVCLSLGLLQEADSRDVVTDILQVLLENSKEKKSLTSNEIKELVEKNRKKHNLELKGIAESNVRRQLKKLKDIFLVESNNNRYNITEFMPLSHLFEKNIKNFYLQNIVERIEEYLKVLDEK
jgi:hypothetical protein